MLTMMTLLERMMDMEKVNLTVKDIDSLAEPASYSEYYSVSENKYSCDEL